MTILNHELRMGRKTLARGTVRDLTIAEPDLEEIFLHYYEKEGEEK